MERIFVLNATSAVSRWPDRQNAEWGRAVLPRASIQYIMDELLREGASILKTTYN